MSPLRKICSAVFEHSALFIEQGFNVKDICVSERVLSKQLISDFPESCKTLWPALARFGPLWPALAGFPRLLVLPYPNWQLANQKPSLLS